MTDIDNLKRIAVRLSRREDDCTSCEFVRECRFLASTLMSVIELAEGDIDKALEIVGISVEDPRLRKFLTRLLLSVKAQTTSMLN